jgi:dihydrofolate reductase
MYVSLKKDQSTMRNITVCTFMTMDGVIQSPGSPEEDTKNSFKWGGWSAHHWDELMNQAMAKTTSQPYDLLLGRRTYDIFAAFWPNQEPNPTTDTFNKIQKFVVSKSAIDLTWENSTLLSADVISSLQALKNSEGPNLLIYGSSNLVQTLLKHQLIDVMQNWIFPITLGTGQKLYEHGTQPVNWKLLNAEVSTTGVIIVDYALDGAVKTGQMSL